jgi:hypothetical protein
MWSQLNPCPGRFGFLILTALKMALIKGSDDVSQNIAVRLCKRFFRVTEFYDGEKFFTKRTLKAIRQMRRVPPRPP